MTALEWFALAAVLAAAGLGLLAAARQGRPVFTRVQPAEPRTHLPEGGCTGPPTGDLFTPVVEPTPDRVAQHRRNCEETP